MSAYQVVVATLTDYDDVGYEHYSRTVAGVQCLSSAVGLLWSQLVVVGVTRKFGASQYGLN